MHIVQGAALTGVHPSTHSSAASHRPGQLLAVLLILVILFGFGLFVRRLNELHCKVNPCEFLPFIAVLFAMIGSKWQQQARLIVVFSVGWTGLSRHSRLGEWSHSPVGEEKR